MKEPRTTVAFDIETAPMPAMIADLEPPSPPANYKDPAKIAAWQDDALNKAADRMALDPIFGRIIACTFATWPTNPGLILDEELAPNVKTILSTADGSPLTAASDDDSMIVREILLVLAEYDQLVTFNGHGFDLPFILRRAMLNRTVIADTTLAMLTESGYASPYAVLGARSPHCDVMLTLHNGEVGGLRGSSPVGQKRDLHYYAKHLLGLTPVGEEHDNKTMLADCFAQGDFQKIINVCEFDASATLQLHALLARYEVKV